MGYFNRDNPGSGKRKFDAEREKAILRMSPTQKLALGLLFFGALLFFLSSFGLTLSAEFFFQGAWQGILIILAILMVAVAIWDREDRFKQKQKKIRLLARLRKQKGALKNRFDLRKNLTSRSQETDLQTDRLQSSLNFATDDETANEGISKTKVSETDIIYTSQNFIPNIQKTDPEDRLNESQTNLARILVEGESISSFPTEWQEFFIENDGKDPTDKLNNILRNGKHES